MSGTTGLSLLGEAELHGLVDGHIEVDRRADVLRRLAASMQDRALVEAWQEQGDLIRAAFRDVAREPLPVALDLAPPRLRCVEPLPRPVESLPQVPAANHRRSALATVATTLVVAVGLVGAWLMIEQAGHDDGAPAPPQTLEAALADRAAAAVVPGAPGTTPPSAGGGLPAPRIPDLTSAGLRLTGVSSQPGEPASLLLRYSDGSDGRVAVSVARAPQDALPAAPAAIGKSLTWRRRDTVFAIAGTLPPDRLQAIATALQDDAAR